MVITVGALDFNRARLMLTKFLNLRVQLFIGSNFASSDVGDYFAADGLASLYFGNILGTRSVSSFGEYIGLEQFQGFTDCLVVVHRRDNLIHTFNALQDFFSIFEWPEHKPFFPEQEIVVVQYHHQPVTQFGRLSYVCNMTYMYRVKGSTYCNRDWFLLHFHRSSFFIYLFILLL